MIIALDGQAAVKRNGWREYTPALFGMLVKAGDLVRVTGSGRVTLACADLQVMTVEGGPNGLPCAPSAAPITFAYDQATVNITRGNTPALQVISPRKTHVLDPHPLLRWTAVPGAQSYHVTLQGVDWSVDVGGQTELAYPVDAPPLQAGKTYKLVVTAGSLTSEDEATPGLGFSLLPAAEAEPVRASEKKIAALQLADAPTRLLIANLYAGHGLYAEAIQQMEGLAGGQEPAVGRMLADLYLQTGLVRLAEQQYLDALALSEQAGDLEGQALAQRALGDIYSQTLSNPDEAAQRWQQSLDLYERLGDVKMVEQLKRHASP
jgi:tetratricopeptide (TPR) repeat protein